MEKAYDLKLLGEELKKEGLEIAEESLKIIVEATFNFVEKSAKLSETVYDDMALLILPQVKKMILEQVEKINKEDNE
tara:strand:- start:1663 stop:1893 length:231 start_codon:yes stop_codon:yes gene_type:complete